MVGLPTLAGFIVKLQIASAGVSAGAKAIPTLVTLALSTVLNTVYFLRTMLRIYTPAEGHVQEVGRAHWLTPSGGRVSTTIAYVSFIALNFLFGLCSQPVLALLEQGLQLFR